MINPDKVSAGPVRHLYIYYLKGRLQAESGMFQKNFIGNWEEENDSFLFFSSPASSQIRNLLYRQRQLSYVDSYQMTYDQWLGEAFTTFEHGIFYISPPWEAAGCRIGSGRIGIVLDPGLVFGTGTHPTTRHCLDALESAARSGEFRTVLDLGTGTGLLALAAARLGCQHVVAVDLNLLAARTAAKNVRMNGLEDQVVIVQANAEDIMTYPADLVIANIHYDVMRHLIESKCFLDKKRFILSGLLRSEAKDIAAKLSRYPVKIIKEWTHDGVWHTFYGRSRENL